MPYIIEVKDEQGKTWLTDNEGNVYVYNDSSEALAMASERAALSRHEVYTVKDYEEFFKSMRERTKRIIGAPQGWTQDDVRTLHDLMAKATDEHLAIGIDTMERELERRYGLRTRRS